MAQIYNIKLPNMLNKPETKKQRNSIIIDKYATFKWRGVDSYEYFGCFIQNNKDLKWVLSEGFSDEYTKPLFSEEKEYLGSTPSNKTLKLDLAFNCISKQDFNMFVNWISYKTVGHLEYGYNKGWSYIVKVSNIGEATFYPGGFLDGEEVFYATVTVSFQTIKDHGLVSNTPWTSVADISGGELNSAAENLSWNFYFPHFNFSYEEGDITYHNEESELSTSIKITDLISSQKDASYTAYIVQIDPDTGTLFNKVVLFSFVCNLNGVDFAIEYDSKTGLLTINNSLLSLLTVNSTGEYLVQGYRTIKMLLPGTLNNSLFANSIKKQINEKQYSVYPFMVGIETTLKDQLTNPVIEIYPRKQL